MTCPKCSIQLHEGFLLEATRNSRGVTEWVEGKPVASFWTGLRLKGRIRLPVASYRCPRCGFLELYAPVGGGSDR
jgi:DNA-directed RNA polymerase subunit RPC12/RpoP